MFDSSYTEQPEDIFHISLSALYPLPRISFERCKEILKQICIYYTQTLNMSSLPYHVRNNLSLVFLITLIKVLKGITLSQQTIRFSCDSAQKKRNLIMKDVQNFLRINFFSDVTKHETSSNHPSTLNHYNTYNKYSVSDHNIRKSKPGFPRIKMFYLLKFI